MASALSNRQNCACARKHYKHNEDGRTAPGVCGNGSVPLSHSGNVVTRIGIHTHTYESSKLLMTEINKQLSAEGIKMQKWHFQL